MTRTGIVPTAPPASRDPLLQQVLGLIPSDPSGVYRRTQSNGSTTQIALARLDYLHSATHSFTLTFADRRGTTDDPADSSVFGPKPTTTIGLSAPFYSASWRWSATARLTNEVRAAANLADIDFRNSLRSRFGFIAVLDDPTVAVSQPMAGLDPERRADHQYGYQDNLTWIAGKHILQAGLADQLAHHAFRRRRTADIAQTNEQNGRLRHIFTTFEIRSVITRLAKNSQRHRRDEMRRQYSN